jgi:hypothetical protein
MFANAEVQRKSRNVDTTSLPLRLRASARKNESEFFLSRTAMMAGIMCVYRLGVLFPLHNKSILAYGFAIHFS